MSDKISFVFPAKADYISAIRLAASGVACGFDYDLDKIEDIKSCVAEACLLLMCSQSCESLSILLECGEDIRVRVSAVGASQPRNCQECMDFSAEMSKMMIEALSQEVSFVQLNQTISEVVFVIQRETEV